MSKSNRFHNIFSSLWHWFDTKNKNNQASDKIDWIRVIPFIAMHITCIGIIWVGWSPFAIGVAIFLYAIRMFAITGFYHRCFSHKAFKTSRLVQFLFAVIGSASVQRGPIWWAAHHRHHHSHSDTCEDLHSPVAHSFFKAHMGWFMTQKGFVTHWDRVKDLARFPELRLLDRFDLLIPVLLAVCLLWLGNYLEQHFPQLNTNGPQLLIWGFFVSTVVLFHATVTINSLAHRFGRRRYATKDNSRNNFWLALITFGEGWHNNHHHYPGSVRQGFFWWELDLTYYLLKVMSLLGLIWNLKSVPKQLKYTHKLPE